MTWFFKEWNERETKVKSLSNCFWVMIISHLMCCFFIGKCQNLCVCSEIHTCWFNSFYNWSLWRAYFMWFCFYLWFLEHLWIHNPSQLDFIFFVRQDHYKRLIYICVSSIYFVFRHACLNSFYLNLFKICWYLLQYNKQHILPLENIKLETVEDDGSEYSHEFRDKTIQLKSKIYWSQSNNS